MREITLFIAMSLDGYIADVNGNVDWLGGENPGADDMVSYNEFIKNIDTIIMGWTTYHQIVTELSPEKWIYEGMTSYVLTHQTLPDTQEVKFMNQDVCELVTALKQKPGKGIWICGGASIIKPLIEEALIDRYHISIIPVILGNGIRLFNATDTKIPLKLSGTYSYNGITDLIYKRR